MRAGEVLKDYETNSSFAAKGLNLDTISSKNVAKWNSENTRTIYIILYDVLSVFCILCYHLPLFCDTVQHRKHLTLLYLHCST